MSDLWQWSPACVRVPSRVEIDFGLPTVNLTVCREHRQETMGARTGMRRRLNTNSVRLFLWAGIIAILGLSGCLISYDPDSVDLVGGGSEPRLLVTSPSPGQEVEDILRIQMEVHNFLLVDPAGRENADGEGHVKIYINGVPIVDNDGPTFRTSIPVQVCSLGRERAAEYNLTIVPSNNDGTPHGVLGEINITWVKLPNGPGGPCDR